MTALTNPNITIYEKLQEIGTLGGYAVTVLKNRPDELTLETDVLLILYRLSSNVPDYVLEGDIAKQDTEIIIDLYGMSSIACSTLLTTVEEKMRELNYRLVENMEIPDPQGYHITTQFNF